MASVAVVPGHVVIKLIASHSRHRAIVQASSCNGGMPGFMENLYLCFCPDHSLESKQASGLQRFSQKMYLQG